MAKNKTGNALPVPSQSDLKAMFYYDDELGCLRWKIKISDKINIGDIAGTVEKNGYTRIMVNGGRYQAHRLIYQLHKGNLDPLKVVDHEDGNPSNNKIDNLKQVTQRHNTQKKKQQSNNTTGLSGVHFMKDLSHQKSPWQGYYKDENGKHISKYFKNKYEAYHFYAENSARVMGKFYIEKPLSTEDRHAYIDWLIEESDKENQDLFKLAA